MSSRDTIVDRKLLRSHLTSLLIFTTHAVSVELIIPESYRTGGKSQNFRHKQ
ncbi:hypothetical protein [Nostoc sp. 'Peltigera membranacea cyanobiont' 213]|uniref:hypothetical protein n=1 Tax=Nostoc sp. 'Peltigera membranacea cyanobiont' 213 TaxID=2014530 RepID=UPI00167E9838|nr:hypothetical protein [Nostoc sp. 'Peltigera membranacea cyanobiont' 213]